ncbi:MAPEG family protein [Bradyrhizobium sp. RD5-C2]|uniref:MAPEG family protein n=1 Tax=Bradyrhizobium sp. RD5-C2 TaxID=244562 RepID=UPI001CC4EDB4|nr:MAPEG family protein [Bradyrhizobium sp. RD5-C2]
MSSTAFSLIGFISWALFLLLLMETIRTCLVVTGRVQANGFAPDNANLSPFMRRLARAHANCIEGLPVFGGLLAFAILLNKETITDALALWFLAARLAQSIIHLVSTSSIAVSLRFSAFAAQMAIGVYWAWRLAF